MAIQRIQTLLNGLLTNPHFPPTTLYNEGWLLRIILDWFAQNETDEHPLTFHTNAIWYSEAQMPSAFQARVRGDTLGETRTHADGVIGHFDIGQHSKAGFDLHHDARQFVVLEAKMSSSLRKGTKNAPYFDQAARNVACMAEVLSRANRKPDQLMNLGFYVLAPLPQIEKGTFKEKMEPASIQAKVSQRVEEYKGEKDDWHEEWFKPLINQIDIQTISWESIIDFIKDHDSINGPEIEQFYQYCLQFNG